MLQTPSLQNCKAIECYVIAVSVAFILVSGNAVILDFDNSDPQNDEEITHHAIDTLKNSIKSPIVLIERIPPDPLSLGDTITTIVTRDSGLVEISKGTGEGEIIERHISIPNGATW